MIEKIFLGFIYDALDKKNPKKIKLPKKEWDILNLTKESIDFLVDLDNLSSQPNDILKSFVDCIELDIVPELDKLSADYFILDYDEKYKIMSETLSKKGLMWDEIRRVLLNYSYEDIQSTFKSIVLRVYSNKSELLIQSARECDPKLKKEIRKSKKDYFVSFQVQSDLLGGMRIYSNGLLVDGSWLGKVSALHI